MFQKAVETAERCGVGIYYGWDAYTEKVSSPTGHEGVVVYASSSGEFAKHLQAFVDHYLETGEIPTSLPKEEVK